MAKKRRYNRPNTTYSLTRRTAGGIWWINPRDPKVKAIFNYALAWAGKRNNVRAHMRVGMSNHVHLIIHDQKGNVSRFCQNLFWMTAIHMNRLLNRRGSFWEPGGCNIVELTTSQSVVDKVAYAALNPVAAGVVESPEDWEGMISLGETLGGDAVTVARPVGFLREGGACEATLELKFEPLADFTPEKWRRAVEGAIRAGLPAARARPRCTRPFELGYVGGRLPVSTVRMYAGNRTGIRKAKRKAAQFDRGCSTAMESIALHAVPRLPVGEVGLRQLLAPAFPKGHARVEAQSPARKDTKKPRSLKKRHRPRRRRRK